MAVQSSVSDLPETAEPATLDEMVLDMMPQARAVARREYSKAPHVLEYAELEALAYAGLWYAASRWPLYCEEHGYDPAALQYFRPYALFRMRGEIMDSLRASDWTTRSHRAKSKLLREAGQDAGASDQELATRTELSVDEVRENAAEMAKRPVPLDVSEHDQEDRGSSVESSVFVRYVLERVVARVRELSPSHQAVLALRYFHGLELREVARKLQLPDARVSSLHVEAVLTVHDVMKEAVAERG